MLRFVDQVNHHSPEITADDMQPLYAAGWDDAAIYYAITVCALFNFYNRWVDASGVHALSDEDAPRGREAVGQHGLCQEVIPSITGRSESAFGYPGWRVALATCGGRWPEKGVRAGYTCFGGFFVAFSFCSKTQVMSR